MRVRAAWMFVVGALLLVTSEACASIPAELEGDWQASGVIGEPSGDDPGMAWLIELHLEGDSFVRTGYPPWDEHATVSSVEQDGNTYRLTLTDHERNGETVEGEVVTLVLSDDGQNLEYDGQMLYRHVVEISP